MDDDKNDEMLIIMKGMEKFNRGKKKERQKM